MRNLILILIFICLFVFVAVCANATQVDVGVSIGEEGLRGFYLAVGDYFRVPEREVIIIRERRIPDEEIPVIFFIAARARVAPSVVIDLRLGGRSWMDITLYFKLSPDIYYVPVKGKVKGPPYGKAYGYYKNKNRKDWGKIVLSNPEIINLVNLRFISEYHHFAPEEVIRLRADGKNFVVINDEVKKGKAKEKEKGPKENDKGPKENDKGKGKGKGKGNS
jgi:hypothetical protein